MNVVHFHRKPTPGGFSIERYFADVRRALPADIQVDVSVSKFASRGIVRRILDMARAVGRQRDVNHITGDVHFLALFLNPARTILTILDCGRLKQLRGLRRSALRQFWFRLPSKRAAVITVISHATKQALLDERVCDPERIVVIHCNVSPEFVPWPREFNSACPTILQVGTTDNKNIERVAQSLAGLQCRLVVVGRLSAPQRHALRSNRICFESLVDVSNHELVSLYRSCDLVMFASTYEGFGLPIVEANATGRPVLTSNVASMPEIAADAACFVDPHDCASIRAGVERICLDASYRNQLIANGFRNVERFRVEPIAAAFAALYRQVHAAAEAGR